MPPRPEPRRYAVKEMFATLQGEGAQSGRRALFIRFAGCNLWSGREADRAAAVCRFCDTDFVGTDGVDGGRLSAAEIAARAAELWGPAMARRYAVLTGGEPMLQVDAALLDALHGVGFEIAMESNGTLPAAPGLDWLCVSPKAGSTVVQRSGDELKLVWPQEGIDPGELEGWDFRHFFVQPKDDADARANLAATLALVHERPRWRLSLQSHKLIGIP